MPEFMDIDNDNPLFYALCEVLGKDKKIADQFPSGNGQPREVECHISGVPIPLSRLMAALNAGWERTYKARVAGMDEEVEKRAKALIEGTVLQDAYYKLQEVTQGVLGLVKDFTAAEKAAWEVIKAREGNRED